MFGIVSSKASLVIDLIIHVDCTFTVRLSVLQSVAKNLDRYDYYDVTSPVHSRLLTNYF